MSNQLFTIGHSTHTVEDFIKLLQAHQIKAVYDVRSIPYSRFNSQFNREKLEQALLTRGISYVFFGKELGARSDNPACYKNGKIQYDRLTKEPLFKTGLNAVKQGIAKHRAALMCAEKDPLTCHRTILVCRELRSPDIEISHILADGSLEAHSKAEERLVKKLKNKSDVFIRTEQQDMFIDTEWQSVEEAYNLQAEKIAYVKKPLTTKKKF